ncbi:MAG: potassium-transporting ATPase subunit KdpC [Candidatus Obscuribacterales bacterium]|jgi:K+-transporting ATPase ATPase C chain
MSVVRPTLILFFILTVLTGVIYPALVTGAAQLLFKDQAEGSIVFKEVEGKRIAIGSKLIGQSFTSPKYFWPRPSATSPAYNAAASSGSNLGPTNKDLIAAVNDRVKAIKAANPGWDNSKKIPVDLITASGSGLDPDISPEAASLQLARVAHARDLPIDELTKIVTAHTKKRMLGFLGEPRVNVLELNLALDDLR